MKTEIITNYIESCKDCKSCLDSCDTYRVTLDEIKSPNGRLKIAGKILGEESITSDELVGIYTCTLCGMCDLECPQNIPITEIVHAAKFKLVELNKAPLEIHKKITKGIVEKDNSVNGNPDERLDWIPEKYRNEENFEKVESDTLLYLGCMSSFRVKESASASYELLKRCGYNFKILEKEPCCGEYVYSSGDKELALNIFNNNHKLFKKNNVKRIIVTCGGCLYAFSKIYPKYIPDWNISVNHIVQIIANLVKQDKLKFHSLDRSITYHDSCRMGRKLDKTTIYDEPRLLLGLTGTEIRELSNNKEKTPCCGAGSGIRGVDSSISIKIGSEILENLETEELITSCPLCVFNYRYVDYKKELNKSCRYITDYLLDALE